MEDDEVDIAPFEEDPIMQMQRYRNKKKTTGGVLDFNIARIQRLKDMKNLVASGATNSLEDISLLREFTYLEKSSAFHDARHLASQGLAKRNL